LEEAVQVAGNQRGPPVQTTARENARLKRMLAELTLDKSMLHDLMQKTVAAENNQ
jgi:hypothetical protein